MKKRVRVYKPGGQTNQPTHEQIVDYISQRMSSDDYDGDTDALKDELAQAGIQDETADEYISNVSDELGLNNQSQTVDNEQLVAEQEQQAADEEQALLEEQEAADQARQARLAAMYDTNIDMSTTEDTPEDEENYMRQGGSKLSKRSFIKEYTKLAKMGQGGNTPSPGANDVLNGRESHVKGFLGAVKNTATEAAMKQEAENRFNSAYGAPQVGAFQNGGIQQEQVDIENPMHHIGAYATGLGDIFRNNQNIQNDAPQGQLGGFTDTDSGLYKFIGGGDNESADEQYQDADIDFNQEEYQMGGFRMPRRSGRQYAQAVNSPYYTATGERAAAPNLAGRQVTSVNVTKKGIFGRPKAYTVNYGNPNATTSSTTQQIKMPTEDEAKKLDAKYATEGKDNYVLSKKLADQIPNQQRSGNRQPVADWMMRSGIPGIKQMGARMTKSGMIPEIEAGTEKVIPPTTTAAPASNEPYYPPMDARAQRRESRDDAKLNRFLGTNDATAQADAKEIARLQNKMPGYTPFKKQGGPIDYTEYAYGGDIAIPELHKYQMDGQVSFDPNANNMSISNLQGFFDKAPTKDVTGAPIQATVPESMQPKNITIDPNQPNKEAVTDQPDNYSQDYQVKRDWGKIGSDVADVAAVGKVGLLAGLDTLDKINARKQENQLLENTTSAEANYGISNADNRGNYDPNSGLFRPDQMGSNAVVKYGGGIYATGGNTEDEDEDTQYMTQEEIDDFIANGGELEYL